MQQKILKSPDDNKQSPTTTAGALCAKPPTMCVLFSLWERERERERERTDCSIMQLYTCIKVTPTTTKQFTQWSVCPDIQTGRLSQVYVDTDAQACCSVTLFSFCSLLKRNEKKECEGERSALSMEHKRKHKEEKKSERERGGWKGGEGGGRNSVCTQQSKHYILTYGGIQEERGKLRGMKHRHAHTSLKTSQRDVSYEINKRDKPNLPHRYWGEQNLILSGSSTTTNPLVYSFFPVWKWHRKTQIREKKELW